MCLSDAQLATVRVLRDRFVFPFKLASGATDYVGYGAMGGEAGPNMWLPADIGGKAPPVPQPPGIWFLARCSARCIFRPRQYAFHGRAGPEFPDIRFRSRPVQRSHPVSLINHGLDQPGHLQIHGTWRGKLIMKENTCDYFRSVFLGVITIFFSSTSSVNSIRPQVRKALCRGGRGPFRAERAVPGRSYLGVGRLG